MNGVDLSNNNGGNVPADFATLGFCFAKASEGVSFTDSTFTGYGQKCVEHGVIFGGYHFAHPDANPANAEADYFLARSHPAVLLAVDIESRAGHDPLAIMGGKGLAQWVNDWCARVRSTRGITPFVYCNKSYLTAMESTLGNWPIWLATLNGHPQAPSWAGRIVSIEQYAIESNFDRDISYVDLGHPVPDPTPQPVRRYKVNAIVSDPTSGETQIAELRDDGLVWLRNIKDGAGWYNTGPVPDGRPLSMDAGYRKDGTLDVSVRTDKGATWVIGAASGKPFGSWYVPR